MARNMNLSPEEQMKQLEEENRKLQEKNQKLYNDCVTFAKKLKQIQKSGVLDVDIDSLKMENEHYQNELSSMKEEINHLTNENQSLRQSGSHQENRTDKQSVPQPEPKAEVKPAPKAEVKPEPEKQAEAEKPAEPEKQPEPSTVETPGNEDAASPNIFFTKNPRVKKYGKAAKEEAAKEEAAKEEAAQTEAPVVPAVPYGRQIQPAARTVKTGVSGVIRIIALVIAIIIGVVGVISAICGAYAKHPDATLFGARAYTVSNNNVSTVTTSSVVFVKKSDMSMLQQGDIVLSTEQNRSLSAVQSIDVDQNSETVLSVADNAGNQYTVSKDQYLGKVQFKLPGLGKMSIYACVHTYNYFAILLAVLLLMLALLLFIPSKKAKMRKLANQ